MSMGRWSHHASVMLAIGVAAALTACGSRPRPAADADAGQQQAIERARNLCQDLGYISGTVDFARCAQSEYDRFAGPPPVAAAASRVSPSAVAAQSPTSPAVPTAPVAAAPARADDEEDWLVRWFKRPNYCQTAACTVR